MRLPLFALCLALLPTAHAAEISWNVRLTEIFAEGVVLQRVAFTDGEKNYALSMDGETKAEVSGAGSRFTYRGVPSAAFEIQPSPVTPPQPFDGETLERYRTAAKLRVPAGVEAIADLEETRDPLAINDWTSFRLCFTYSQHGRKVRKSVTFLTLQQGQQALLEVAAYEEEFKAAMERSEYLIRSWHALNLKAATPDN